VSDSARDRDGSVAAAKLEAGPPKDGDRFQVLGPPDPRQLPPGPERRLLLLEGGQVVTFADFDDEERAELIADLRQIKDQIRKPRWA
jgi:hypothetical protein